MPEGEVKVPEGRRRGEGNEGRGRAKGGGVGDKPMAEGNRHRLFQMTPVSKGWRCGSAQLKLLKNAVRERNTKKS